MVYLFNHIIDIIDYVNGIGNSSREQYMPYKNGCALCVIILSKSYIAVVGDESKDLETQSVSYRQSVVGFTKVRSLIFDVVFNSILWGEILIFFDFVGL